MKKLILTLGLFLSAIVCHGQWVDVGETIYGINVNDATGSSVSLNASGDRMAIVDTFFGSDTRGGVRVFELQNGSWTQLGNEVLGLPVDNESAGNVVLNSTGDRFVYSSPLHNGNGLDLSGAVRVFELQNGTWNQLGTTLYGEMEGDFFGTAVDINVSGNRIVSGAHQIGVINNNKGYVKVFEYENNTWNLLGERINGEFNDDEAGRSVNLSGSGDRVVIAIPRNDSNGTDAGQVKIYNYQNSNWKQLGNTIFGENPGDAIGYANEPGSNGIALNTAGNRIAIGAANNVRVYSLSGNTWLQIGNDIIENNDGYFGGAIDINGRGNILVVGDFSADSSIGKTYVYRLEGATWVQKGPAITGTEVADFLGFAVGINASGDRIIVGTPFSDDVGKNQGKAEVFQNNTILSIPTIDTPSTITLHPNPNNGNFKLRLSALTSDFDVTITDTSGKEVYFKTFLNSEEIEVDHNMQAGIYLLRIRSEIETSFRKFIVE